MNNFIQKYREIISYIFIGGLTTIVSLGTYYLLVIIFLDPSNAFQLQVANIISWIAAVIFAYFTNRAIVFKSTNQDVFREMMVFCFSRVGTLLVDMLSMYMMVTLLEMNDKISKIIVQFIVMILNYVISKFMVFVNRN